MKYIIPFVYLVIGVSFQIAAQINPICADVSVFNIKHYGKANVNEEEINKVCGFTDNEYAYRRIDSLMKLAGLPMNFTVCKVQKIQNAYAYVDSNGTRFIVYDDDFLKRLDADNSRIQTITALAHEIGHHLSAHTLLLNNEDYAKAYKKYCSADSPDFNKKACAEQTLKYLKLQRGQELEADRFAGYIMYKYGASLAQVTEMYSKITNNNDDTLSTHPSLNKRIDAAKAGFELAQMKAKAGIQKIDLQEIKGSMIDFEVKNLGRMERNRLMTKIRLAATADAESYVAGHSKYNFTYWLNTISYTYHDKILQYLGKGDDYLRLDTDDEYFELLTNCMRLMEDPRIQYEPVAAIHVKNNILKILIFSTPASPKVVYSAPFSENEISLEEIKAIFIEIYRKGIQSEINKFN